MARPVVVVAVVAGAGATSHWAVASSHSSCIDSAHFAEIAAVAVVESVAAFAIACGPISEAGLVLREMEAQRFHEFRDRRNLFWPL